MSNRLLAHIYSKYSLVVYNEVAESVDNFAFLEAFFRFGARCSKPHDVYSDHGLNFIGRKSVLADGIKNLNCQVIDKDLSPQDIQ